MNKYYYTFGTSKQFPYTRGYVIVYAFNQEQANDKFRKRFPDFNKGIINCAFIYNEEEFNIILKRLVKDYGEKILETEKCHEIID